VNITGAQAKAARLLLGWSQPIMASHVHVTSTTISNFENRKLGLSAATVAEIRYVLEKAGIEFTNGGEPGVKLRRPL
jgi:transcriptional regulator with XRE-family HTH domain